MSHFHGMATIALDLAIEIDRSIRSIPSPLGAALELAGRLEAVFAEDHPTEIMDLWETVGTPSTRPETMTDLGLAVAERAETLRRVAAGDRSAFQDGLDYCLRLHRMLLARAHREWGPFGLAA